MLHDEFHKAEERVAKKMNTNVSNMERTIGVAQYLHCTLLHGLTREELLHLLNEQNPYDGHNILYS